jgi:SecD/SecF fusion protein
MDRHAWWKWALLAALIGLSLWAVIPPKDKIRLGLDLRGGSSFTVRVDEESLRREIRNRPESLTPEQVEQEVRKVMNGAQDRALEVLRNRVDNLGISEPSIYRGGENRIIIQLPGVDEAKRKEAEESIRSVAFLEFRMVHEKNDELVRAIFDKGLAPEGYRVDMMSGKPYYRRDAAAVPDSAMNREFRERQGRFQVPDAAHEFLLSKDEEDGQTVYRPYFVRRRRELSGDSLKTAAVDYRTLGQPVVTLQFDAKGARKFANITADYAPGGPKNPSLEGVRYLAIVLDGTLYSAPYIREAIYGGKAEISGSFTVAEASLLSNILNAGSLPAPVEIVERRIVDPLLGEDSIRSGVRAGLYGCGAVVALMALYYLLPGLIADLALALNVVLLPLGLIAVAGFLDIFSGIRAGRGPIALPVLTLPGIAGIALTVGMAVDANVLIFERLREEMRAGKSFAGAVKAGYERAFTAIFDSNITTIITAVILFFLGAGPIRGYAVTLTAGLLVSLYTAVVVSRMCFDAIAAKRPDMKLLRMRQLFRESNLDFMKWWKVAVSVSLVVIAASWALMVWHGLKKPSSVFGVDFTGGSAVTLGFDQASKAGVEDVRAALGRGGVQDAGIQYQRAMKAGEEEVLQIKVAGVKDGAAAERILAEKFPASKFRVLQQDDVGPQISGELKRKAAWAMLGSLAAMIIYISVRFEFGFALGAVVALFHDVLVTAGVCHVLGIQMSLTVVAALMTIVGYSVNDTIVIFDRIREDLRLIRGKTFLQICNLSMNQTLSRTLLTNFLTFVSVLSLVVFGGGAIRDFSVAMFIGMVAGTYSTMYIATPVVLMWHRNRLPELAAPAKPR